MKENMKYAVLLGAIYGICGANIVGSIPPFPTKPESKAKSDEAGWLEGVKP